MAYRDDSGRDPHETYEPYRQTRTTQGGLPLHHRVSALTVYDGDDNDPSRPQLQSRESMVSLDSFVGSPSPHENEYGGHTYSPGSNWSGSFGYSGGGGGYTPVSVSGGPPSRRPSRGGSRMPSYQSSLGGPVHEEVDEEQYDMSLLQKAAPMARTRQYEPIAEEESFPMGFDVTAALGPTTAQDEAFMKQLQEQEAKGTLTGGLGTGLRPDTTVRDADLLSTPTTVNRSLSRSFSRRGPPTRLGRDETIRHMGQDEANRRGEVIEVIIEEPAGADLSSMEGPNIASDEFRRSTFPTKESKTQIFYPQPNWKPISMRWPYLSLLIVLSIFLAVIQEVLYQKFRHHPILTFKSPDDVEPGLYFTIKFLPTLCAVAYGVFWQFTDFEVRRLEAYYQLSRQQGSLASRSINVDYVTSFNFWRPIRATKLGHYAVALSSVASTLAVSLVPTFAAASVVLTPNRRERQEHPDGDKEVYFAAVWSRLLTATLVLCAVSGSGLFYILQTRRSGLLADVRGISGLASMAVVSHILMDFKDMDTAKHKDIHSKLKNQRYMLRNSSLAPYEGSTTILQEREKDEDAHLSENPHPLMIRPAGSIPFIIGLFLFAGFIPTFLFTPADIITDKAAWVVTSLAVILKLCWGGMETSVRMMEPYYILSRRHAPPKTLMLDYTALPFGYMPLRALLNGHFLVFFMGFGSVMAEFLTIMVTGLATVEGQDFIVGYLKDGDKSWKEKAKLVNSGQETVLSFYVSLGLTLFVLLYMMIVATVVFFRRRHPFLPRQPNTIASILAFIHQSKMLYNFVGTAKLSTAEMAKKLDDGKTYGLGWFQGRDGQTHCGVDQEELTSYYKHGKNYLEGNKPWDTQWDVL
ncbi:Fc.00g098440.m01.CDS01 [Cosmosporella sp. VM-42]